MAEANLTMTTDIAVTARKIDFVSQFAQSWKALGEIMGVTRPIKKTPGTTLRSYRASLVLQDGSVGEGEKIPLSKATIEEVAHKELEVKKHGKGITIEDVNAYGPDVAIDMTDEALRNELIDLIMGEFYEFALTGELKETVDDFQMGVAIAIGSVKDKFKKLHKDGSRVVVWVNTMDAYRYLGAANLDVQTAFGMEYLKSFMGAETLILSSEIPSGTIMATPVRNIVDYYMDPSDSAYARMGLNYTVDSEVPLVGFAIEGDYSTATGKTWAIYGHELWAEYLDAIAVVSVGDAGGDDVGGGDDAGDEEQGE